MSVGLDRGATVRGGRVHSGREHTTDMAGNRNKANTDKPLADTPEWSIFRKKTIGRLETEFGIAN
jgi:hypothetical protein